MDYKKTDRYYFELAIGPLLGILIGVYNFYCPILKGAEKASEIVSKVTDISFIVFGFLLTILAIIMQSGSGIKKSPRYARLVKANALMIVLSLLSGFVSLAIVSQFKASDMEYPHNSLLTTFFFSILTYLIVETAIYLYVFYKLVLNQKL